MFGFFEDKEKKKLKENVRIDFAKKIDVVKSLTTEHQAMVGYGLLTTIRMFNHNFKSPDAFIKLSFEEKTNFSEKIKKFQLSLAEKDGEYKYIAIGPMLFEFWILSTILHDVKLEKMTIIEFPRLTKQGSEIDMVISLGKTLS